MDTDDQTLPIQLLAVREAVVLLRTPVAAPITLDLPRWSSIRTEFAAPGDLVRVREVLQFFVDVAIRNGLDNTTAATKLTRAISVMDQSTTRQRIPGADKISYDSTSLSLSTTSDFQLDPDSENGLGLAIHQLAQRTVFQAPIFNIWDSISMIYTLCVEPVATDLLAELHLYQFRTILRILSLHPYFQLPPVRPTTAVATWSRPQSRTIPCTIAFATTCCGDRVSKRTMAQARVAFARDLLGALDNILTPTYGLLSRYPPGNCPEWITFIIVCRRPGQYNSLCVTLGRLKIYKLCGYCAELQAGLAEVGAHVYDRWVEAYMGIGEAWELDDEQDFSYRALMNYSELRHRYGHIPGV